MIRTVISKLKIRHQIYYQINVMSNKDDDIFFFLSFLLTKTWGVDKDANTPMA